MHLCLPLDWRPGDPVSLAALFRASSQLRGQERLVLCPTPQTLRLFPQLDEWAREEGHLMAAWIHEAGASGDALPTLEGNPPVRFLIDGQIQDWRILSISSGAEDRPGR